MERLQSHRDFVSVLKCRKKATSTDIVVHYLVRDDTSYDGDTHGDLRDMDMMKNTSHITHRRLGLAVSKAVGNAVTRNRVKRRFRVLAREYEDALPPHCDIVMRAKPSTSHATFQSLQQQVSTLFDEIRDHCSYGDQNARHLPITHRDGSAQADIQ